MLSKEPNRSYNTESIENWFHYIQIEWESLFPSSTIEEGRKLYLSGQIQSIELTKDTATIHYAISRKEIFYSIIDWKDGNFKVRSSTTNTGLGERIAVGGLYEIEELVADEISPIGKFFDCVESEPSNRNKNKQKVQLYKNPKSLRHHNSNEVFFKLALDFYGSEEGLILKSWWIDPSGKKASVFKSNSLDISEADREQVVQFTVLTREVGFEYRKSSDDFILKDFDRIAGFFSHGRKRWDAIFDLISLDTYAKEMAKGVNEIEIIARAEGAGRTNMYLNYEFRLGSNFIESEDIRRLAVSKKRTQYFKGKGILSIKESQSKALQNWGVGFNAKTLKEWPRYMLYSLWLDEGIHFNLAGELKRWRDRLNNKRTKENSSGLVLPNFLREYQAEGVIWMRHIQSNGGHGLLADEMGLGKTLQVLTLIYCCAKFERSSLVVCPASVVPVWKSEVERWYPELKVNILRSDKIPKKEKGIIWISSYSLLRRNIDLIKSAKFEYVVLDEAQCIKNPTAKVSRACYELNADFRLAITGTPLENKLLDLWSIFNFLMPGLMGSIQQFTETLESTSLSNSSDFAAHVKKQISPFVLRRLKERVAKELPEKTEVDLICPIKGKQRELYNGFLNQGVASLGSSNESKLEKTGMNLFTLLTRLRQACCDPGIIPEIDFSIEDSGKVVVLLSRLEEAFDGTKKRKVVIFSQFVKFLVRLKPLINKVFPEVNLYELNGSTRDRSKPVSGFQQDEHSAIIFVSLKAGGTGVTLNSADYLFLMDPWWNPAVENQAIDRVHRIGQKLPVFIFRMITKSTIEERIQVLKSEKSALFDSTFGGLNMVKDIQEYFSNLSNLNEVELDEPSSNSK